MSRFWEVGHARWLAGHPDIIVDDTTPEYGLFVGRNDDGVFVCAVGEPTAAHAALLRVYADLPTPRRAILQAEILTDLPGELDAWLGQYRDNAWDMFYAESPVPEPEGADKVMPLETDAWRGDIERILIASNKNTSALRDIDRLSWYGYVEDGILGGVMGAERSIDGDTTHTHFAGLGTDPEAQGRGIGTAIMSSAINQELEHVDLVNFGMWIENDRARRIYNRIGLDQGERMVNCSIEPFDH